MRIEDGLRFEKSYEVCGSVLSVLGRRRHEQERGVEREEEVCVSHVCLSAKKY